MCLLQVCIAILFLAVCVQWVSSEYRYKIRGPPPPPRPPPIPQYVKKWQNGPRGPPPSRQRPIPVHMPHSHKIPLGHPGVSRPIAPPVRNFWKNSQINNFRPPQEKPFLSSPQIGGNIKTKDLDYHIHTNAIPTHTNPIKQVGEKGPIHTIPAPNLSLADKPAVLDEIRKEIPKPHYAPILQSPLQSPNHQYQVTESSEPSYHNQYKQFKLQQPFYQDISGLEAQTSAHKAEQAAVQHPQNLDFKNPNFNFDQQFQLQQNDQASQISDAQISPHELYELLQQNQQPQLLESFKIPVVQQQQQQQFQEQLQQQQISDYQILLNNQQGDKTKSFYDQLQQQQVQPEYHSFNYDEQHHKNAQISGVSVGADYNLEPAADSSELIHTAVARNPNDQTAQAQYVQQYFEIKDESGVDNYVEPDAKSSQDQQNTENSVDAAQSDVISSAFYSTLPNRQAAEALASLQAAGKVNSKTKNQQVEAHHRTPLTIYIPENEQTKNERKEQKDSSLEKQENQSSYGNRIKKKRN